LRASIVTLNSRECKYWAACTADRERGLHRPRKGTSLIAYQ
jgi:hypothetical protein